MKIQFYVFHRSPFSHQETLLWPSPKKTLSNMEIIFLKSQRLILQPGRESTLSLRLKREFNYVKSRAALTKSSDSNIFTDDYKLANQQKPV